MMDKFPVASDLTIFRLSEGQLQLLLIKRGFEPFKGKWALPGGFMEDDEDIDHCARRELQEETGLKDIYLEQLCTTATPGRDPRGHVVSVAYFALMPDDGQEIVAGSDAAEVIWQDAAELPVLAFDHNQIVRAAIERLRAKTEYSTIAFQLLPAEFTLSQLQTVHETILGKELDKRNFRKWVLSLGALEETGSKSAQGAHRPAMLYRAKQPGKIRITK